MMGWPLARTNIFVSLSHKHDAGKHSHFDDWGKYTEKQLGKSQIVLAIQTIQTAFVYVIVTNDSTERRPGMCNVYKRHCMPSSARSSKRNVLYYIQCFLFTKNK